MISLFGTFYRFHTFYQGHWFFEMQRGLKEPEMKQKPYSDDADLKTSFFQMFFSFSGGTDFQGLWTSWKCVNLWSKQCEGNEELMYLLIKLV